MTCERDIGPSANSQTQRWYFEKWHEYQKKKSAIQWLYYDVLKWGSQKAGVELLVGKKAIAVDLGSAHGYVAAMLNKLGYKAYGCELSKYYVKSYVKKSTDNVLVCDAQVLPFACGKIGIITAFELVEHLPRFQQFLSECFGALGKNGVLLVTTPDAAFKPLDMKFWRDYALGSMIFKSHNLEGHSHEFLSSAELKRELKTAGFSKVFVETWWFAPLPPTIFNRYFVGHAPLFMIPHFRCVAIK